MVQDIQDLRDSIGQFPVGTLVGTVAWNPADLVDGAAEVKQVDVPGAAVGDFVLCAHSAIGAGDTKAFQMSGQVTAAAKVNVTLTNNSGGNLNIADGVLTVVVIPIAAAVAYVAPGAVTAGA